MSERRRRYITINVKREDWEIIKKIAEEHKTGIVGAVRILLTYKDVVERVSEVLVRHDIKLDVILRTLTKLEERLEKLEQELRERRER